MRRLGPVVLLLSLLWAPAAGAWTWPVGGPVLQGFSFDRTHPYEAGQHRGIDIGADAAGMPVLAPASGVVGFAGTVPSSGKSVTIDTPDGLAVTLTNLGSISVAKGDAVAEGAAVGTVGPSGTPEAAGPYVHLGIRTAADPQGYLDPLGFLPAAPVAAPQAPPAPAPAPVAAAPPVAAPAAEPTPPAVEASAADAPSVAAPIGAPVAAVASVGTAPSPQVEPEPVASGVAVVAPSAPAAAPAPTLVRAAPPAPPAESSPPLRHNRPQTYGKPSGARTRVGTAPLSAPAAVSAGLSRHGSTPVMRRPPHRDAPFASAGTRRPHVPLAAGLAALLAAVLAAVAAALRRRIPACAPTPTADVIAFPARHARARERRRAA